MAVPAVSPMARSCDTSCAIEAPMAGRLRIQNGAAEPRGARQLDPVWMFPLTYALHVAEEYLAADGFPLWVQRALELAFTTAEFVAWNAFALVLMCVAAWLVSRDAKFRFIEIALAVAVLGNVAAHVLASLVTWTYSPGLITGLVVWSPLGWMRLGSARRASTPRARRAGTYIGAATVLISFGVVGFAAMRNR
jgi:Protein of unknown function with HXXEE motif